MSQNYSNQMQKALQGIFQTFSENGRIDLIKTKQFLDKNKISDSDLFLKKIDRAAKSNSKNLMTKQEFIDNFARKKNNQHYSDVFDFIDQDKSGFISKAELKILSKNHELNLSQNDINSMIDSISKDGQKVSKDRLLELLSPK